MTTAVLLPGGLLAPDPARETYRVAPGGVTEVALAGDDRIRIIDRHGGQVAVLSGGLEAVGLTQRPHREHGHAVRTRDRARARRSSSSPTAAHGWQWPPPGAASSTASEPATELLVEVRRATPRTREELELPPPLAEPRLDFRIDAATAQSYEVRAGEYIQVIDVKGKQCSDFLAFHAGKLQAGIERGLDATVTRTLMGNAYPMPGLYGKFYDLDMDPLCEVVRDTVGRHDTFALACQAKYYEDLGYPGHINCTDNFNGALRQFEIAPRKGWEALNFFFNTAFDRDMAARSPTSRGRVPATT